MKTSPKATFGSLEWFGDNIENLTSSVPLTYLMLIRALLLNENFWGVSDNLRV